MTREGTTTPPHGGPRTTASPSTGQLITLNVAAFASSCPRTSSCRCCVKAPSPRMAYPAQLLPGRREHHSLSCCWRLLEVVRVIHADTNDELAAGRTGVDLREDHAHVLASKRKPSRSNMACPPSSSCIFERSATEKVAGRSRVHGAGAATQGLAMWTAPLVPLLALMQLTAPGTAALCVGSAETCVI